MGIVFSETFVVNIESLLEGMEEIQTQSPFTESD